VPVRKISFIFTLLLILAIAALAFYLIKTAPEPKAELIQTKPVIVTVVQVETRDIRPMRIVSGRLQAATKLGLHFEVGGRIKSRQVEPGQRIKAGELLLALEAGDYRDGVVDAQAQLDQERAAIERDRRLLSIAQQNTDLQAGEVKRLERLSSNSLAAQSLLDESRKQLLQLSAEQESLNFSVNSAQSRIALRESALRRAKRNQARTRLTAPFDSIINRVDAHVGDFVTTAQVVIEVLEQGKLDLAVEVDGNTASALMLQQSVTVTIKDTINDRVLDGEIVALQHDPDSETFTHAVRIRLTDQQLLPGTLASTTLPLLVQENVLVVPVTAVLHEAGAAHVFKVVGKHENTLHPESLPPVSSTGQAPRKRGGTLQRVAVNVGIRDGDEQVISGQINAGDIIVSRDVAALSDGQTITLLP